MANAVASVRLTAQQFYVLQEIGLSINDQESLYHGTANNADATPKDDYSDVFGPLEQPRKGTEIYLDSVDIQMRETQCMMIYPSEPVHC